MLDHKHSEGDMYNEFQNIKQSKLLRPFGTRIARSLNFLVYQSLNYYSPDFKRYRTTFLVFHKGKTFHSMKNYTVSHNTSFHRALRKFMRYVKFHNEATVPFHARNVGKRREKARNHAINPFFSHYYGNLVSREPTIKISVMLSSETFWVGILLLGTKWKIDDNKKKLVCFQRK